MKPSFSEKIHDLINEHQKIATKTPKTIHLGPDDSIEFVKQADELISPWNPTLSNKIKIDALVDSIFPENLEMFGIKILFSQPNKTVIY